MVGPDSHQAHDVVLTSMRRNNVASTSHRRHVPTRFLIYQCQIITFLILKSDNIENSRIRVDPGKYGRNLHIDFSRTIVLSVPALQHRIPVFRFI